MNKQKESHIVWNKHNLNDKIGRGNYKDVIHHKDGNHDDNNIKNLQKMTFKEHTIYHKKGNKYWVGKKHKESTKKKLSIKNTGYKHTEETKKKMSLSAIGNINGITSFLGKKHSEKTKRKMRDAWKRRKNGQVKGST